MRASRHELGGAVVADPLAGLFAEKRKAAAGSATKTALVVARGFDDGPGERCDGAWFVVHFAIAAQIARVVEDDGFSSLGG